MNTVPTPTPTNLFPLSALGQNSAVDSFTIDALENRTVTGKHAHKILYKINVDSNLKVVDSHDVVFIAVRYTAGKPQPYEVYTRLCKAEDPTVKLFKSFRDHIADYSPELLDEFPSLNERVIKKVVVFGDTVKRSFFYNVSDELLDAVLNFAVDHVPIKYESRFLQMFPDVNDAEFIIRQNNVQDSIDEINSAFDADWTIDFVTGDVISESRSDAIHVSGEGYTVKTEDYRLCQDDNEWHHVDDCAYVDCEGDYYTTWHYENNYAWCEYCERDYSINNGCDCRCGVELHCSSANVLHVIGDYYVNAIGERVNLDDKKKGLRTYGLEIEYSKFNEFDSDKVTQRTLILKEDGTPGVTGEINTLPFTFQALHTETPLDELWDYVKQVDYEGGRGDVEQCGIHVHVSRDSVSDIQIAKLECLINMHSEHLAALARRDYANNSYTNRCMTRNAFVKPDDKDVSKYQPINYAHSQTYEIRIFRSNLRADRIKSCVEFVEFALNLVNSLSITDLKTKSFNEIGFLQALKRAGKTYPNLHKLAVDRGLIAPATIKPVSLSK